MAPPESERDGCYREYDVENTQPSRAILNSIADCEDVEIDQIANGHPDPLYNYIDVDALNELLTTRPSLEVSFPYSDYNIHIDGESVQITSP